MTYTVKFDFRPTPTGNTRSMVTNVAGCVDEDHAERKIHSFYQGVVRVIWVRVKPEK